MDVKLRLLLVWARGGYRMILKIDWACDYGVVLEVASSNHLIAVTVATAFEHMKTYRIAVIIGRSSFPRTLESAGG
jgi:hypothetical protein